jgi:hypothetical protein
VIPTQQKALTRAKVQRWSTEVDHREWHSVQWHARMERHCVRRGVVEHRSLHSPPPGEGELRHAESVSEAEEEHEHGTDMKEAHKPQNEPHQHTHYERQK